MLNNETLGYGERFKKKKMMRRAGEGRSVQDWLLVGYS